MTNRHTLQALRSRAEDLVPNQALMAPPDLKAPSYESMRKMVHELQVHQIELEMQNEELRQTQVELDTARARYFDLYDLAPIGYCTVSAQGLILEANLTAARMLDLVRCDLVQKPVSRFILKTDQDSYYLCRKALLDTCTAQSCELQMCKPGGTPVWVHLRMSTAQDATGAMVQRMVMSDISERKDLDHALRATQAVADKANQAKADFLLNMTHELRSPLNAILGFAQLMGIGTPPPNEAQKSSIDQIQRAGWYLLDLIGEILDLTSIESGRLALTLEPVPLFEVLRDACAAIESVANKKGVAVHCEQPNQKLRVSTDRGRLQQVMVHLLSNAVQYNRMGGTVEVTCLQEPGQRLRVQVRDTGCGVSADKLVQLFHPFNRLGRETSAEEGTGVGLALSKRLIELMGGTIGAQSTAGAGSVFWIELEQAAYPKTGTL